MTGRLRAFGAFWWDFVVGDDPLIALSVVVALCVTALLVAAGISAWWVLPLVAVGALATSVWRAASRRP